MEAKKTVTVVLVFFVFVVMIIFFSTYSLESNNNIYEDFVFDNYTYIIEGRFLLENENNISVTDYVYVSLPQNSTFQKSYILYIDPKPIRYTVDEDGNKYAVVVINAEPGERTWIRVKYIVTVSGYTINFDEKKAIWPRLDLAKRFTGSTGYWDVYNVTLIKLAYKVAYSDNPLVVARKIAEWVVPRISYFVNMGRYGSDHAIVEKFGSYYIVGDCVEVADIYVTFARILGLPSRTAYGILLFSHREKQWLNLSEVEKEGNEILTHWGGHMWPQVYIPPWGWIDVDMLDGMRVNVGIYSNRHILFGVEETKYYGSSLTSSCIPSYLTLQYVEYDYRGED